jgi:pantoate--beta-alanine ligase
VRDEQDRLRREGSEVVLKEDYFEVFEKSTFESVRGGVGCGSVERREMVVSGAVWVGKTRLIDNLLLGWSV